MMVSCKVIFENKVLRRLRPVLHISLLVMDRLHLTESSIFVSLMHLLLPVPKKAKPISRMHSVYLLDRLYIDNIILKIW